MTTSPFPYGSTHARAKRKFVNWSIATPELVRLMDHLKKLPGEVSGGMKKRAGLARAMVTEPEIVLFDEPDSGLDPVRVAYLDELVVTAPKETGATFFIITHNIKSVMRTADYMGILFRSSLVKLASKSEMLAGDNPIFQQFLAGRPEGPIGMDEMADSDGRTHLDADAASLAFRAACPARGTRPGRPLAVRPTRSPGGRIENAAGTG
jgi:phospholipid/cholesterol/gamma-HCH transport system ATP-binding protein